MNNELFDWDFDNLRHIARHGVTPEDAEDVLLGDSLDLGSDSSEGEWRFHNLGATRSGRVLIVIATLRGERIRVVTAFAPDAKLKREFLQSRDVSDL